MIRKSVAKNKRIGFLVLFGRMSVILLATVALFPVVYMVANAFAQDVSMEVTRGFCPLLGEYQGFMRCLFVVQIIWLNFGIR